MTACFCWMMGVCDPQTGGYCKKISKGGDKDPQINAKRVQFEFSPCSPNGNDRGISSK